MWIFDNFFGNQRQPKQKLTQAETILTAMQENIWKDDWDTRDFQSGKYFVGYKSSVIISNLRKKGMIENGEKKGIYQTYRITDKGLQQIIPKK